MSEQTLHNLHEAISLHYRDLNGDHAVLTDWVVGYGGMTSDSDSSNGISHPTGYSTSDSSPYAMLGLMHITLSNLTDDLTPYAMDDDE